MYAVLQIFGEEEKIYGYSDLAINVRESATLLPLLLLLSCSRKGPRPDYFILAPLPIFLMRSLL